MPRNPRFRGTSASRRRLSLRGTLAHDHAPDQIGVAVPAAHHDGRPVPAARRSSANRPARARAPAGSGIWWVVCHSSRIASAARGLLGNHSDDLGADPQQVTHRQVRTDARALTDRDVHHVERARLAVQLCRARSHAGDQVGVERRQPVRGRPPAPRRARPPPGSRARAPPPRPPNPTMEAFLSGLLPSGTTIITGTPWARPDPPLLDATGGDDTVDAGAPGRARTRRPGATGPAVIREIRPRRRRQPWQPSRRRNRRPSRLRRC